MAIMNTKRILLVSGLFFGIAGVVSLQALRVPQAKKPSLPLFASVRTEAAPPPVSPIVGYRSWVRVNQKPHWVTSKIALMCRAPTQEEIAAEAANPHLEANANTSSVMRLRFVTVYVNKIAEQAMLHQKHPAFPEGSMIVKERLAGQTSAVPELITVMHKREQGYNSDSGDWEYMTLDGSGKQITAQGRLKSCESCHAEWKKTDYTSRAYLSEDTLRRFQ